MSAWLTLFLLTACRTEGASPPPPATPRLTFETVTVPTDIDVDGTRYTCTERGEPELLLTPLDEPGAFSVVHTNVAEGGCPDVLVTVYSDVSEETVYVGYAFSSDDCTERCPLALSYTISELNPGDWTVIAGTEEASIVLD